MNILQCQPSTIELRYTPFISDVVGILFLSKCILTYVQKSEFHSFLVQSTQGTLVPVGIICPSQILIPSHCHVQFVHWLKFVFLLSVPPVAWPRCYSFPRVFLEPRSEFIHSQGTSCYLVGILFLPTRVYALGILLLLMAYCAFVVEILFLPKCTLCAKIGILFLLNVPLCFGWSS